MKKKKVREWKQILLGGDSQIEEEKIRKNYFCVFQADNTASVYQKRAIEGPRSEVGQVGQTKTGEGKTLAGWLTVSKQGRKYF